MLQAETSAAFEWIRSLRAGPGFSYSKRAGLHKEASLPLITAQLHLHSTPHPRLAPRSFICTVRESDVPKDLEAVFKDEQCPQCFGVWFVVDSFKGERVCSSCRLVLDTNFTSQTAYAESHGPSVCVKATQFQILPRPHQQSSVKRMTHFRNWLSRLQAKEDKPGIPMDIIRSECAKYGIERPSYENIRFLLKKLRLQRYYNNVYLIIFHITGERLVVLTRQQEETLVRMFALIQPSYTRVCARRVNFISYAFVIRKICQALGWHDLAMALPRLKSDEINYQISKVWHSLLSVLDQGHGQ